MLFDSYDNFYVFMTSGFVRLLQKVDRFSMASRWLTPRYSANKTWATKLGPRWGEAKAKAWMLEGDASELFVLTTMFCFKKIPKYSGNLPENFKSGVVSLLFFSMKRIQRGFHVGSSSIEGILLNMLTEMELFNVSAKMPRYP